MKWITVVILAFWIQQGQSFGLEFLGFRSDRNPRAVSVVKKKIVKVKPGSLKSSAAFDMAKFLSPNNYKERMAMLNAPVLLDMNDISKKHRAWPTCRFDEYVTLSSSFSLFCAPFDANRPPGAWHPDRFCRTYETSCRSHTFMCCVYHICPDRQNFTTTTPPTTTVTTTMVPTTQVPTTPNGLPPCPLDGTSLVCSQPFNSSCLEFSNVLCSIPGTQIECCYTTPVVTTTTPAITDSTTVVDPTTTIITDPPTTITDTTTQTPTDPTTSTADPTTEAVTDAPTTTTDTTTVVVTDAPTTTTDTTTEAVTDAPTTTTDTTTEAVTDAPTTTTDTTTVVVTDAPTTTTDTTTEAVTDAPTTTIDTTTEAVTDAPTTTTDTTTEAVTDAPTTTTDTTTEAVTDAPTTTTDTTTEAVTDAPTTTTDTTTEAVTDAPTTTTDTTTQTDPPTTSALKNGRKLEKKKFRNIVYKNATERPSIPPVFLTTLADTTTVIDTTTIIDITTPTIPDITTPSTIIDTTTVPTTTCSTTTTAQPTTTAPTTFPPGTFCTDWTQAAVLLFVNTTIQKPINVCCFPLCAINTALPNCPYLCWLQPSVPTSFLKVLPMITSIKP